MPTKISQLPAAALPLTGAEQLPMVQLGNTSQATVADVILMAMNTETLLTLNVSAGSPITLSPTQALNSIFEFSGALTGNVIVIFPATPKRMQIDNITTGAFTLTMKTAAQVGGITVGQGGTATVYCNGPAIEPSNSGPIADAQAAAALDATTKANAALAAALAAGGLGIGQTWQDVTATRTAGVNYTNTTGKPIAVAIAGGNTAAGNGGLRGYAGGVAALVVDCSAGANVGGTFIVPPGAVYYVTISGLYSYSAFGAPYGWKELR